MTDGNWLIQGNRAVNLDRAERIVMWPSGRVDITLPVATAELHPDGSPVRLCTTAEVVAMLIRPALEPKQE